MAVVFLSVWAGAVLLIDWRWPRREPLADRLARWQAHQGVADAEEWLGQQ